jgi:hypothetical protein
MLYRKIIATKVNHVGFTECDFVYLFVSGAKAPSGPGPPHSRGF